MNEKFEQQQINSPGKTEYSLIEEKVVELGIKEPMDETNNNIDDGRLDLSLPPSLLENKKEEEKTYLAP